MTDKVQLNVHGMVLCGLYFPLTLAMLCWTDDLTDTQVVLYVLLA